MSASNKSINERAIEWSLSDDTGISSETLCRYMLGIRTERVWNSPPSDTSDRGRCIRLLNRIPEWWPRLDEIAEAKFGDPASVNGLTSGDLYDKHTWKYQIKLMRAEAKK